MFFLKVMRDMIEAFVPCCVAPLFELDDLLFEAAPELLLAVFADAAASDGVRDEGFVGDFVCLVEMFFEVFHAEEVFATLSACGGRVLVIAPEGFKLEMLTVLMSFPV
jgi:hypothetical protein